MVISFHKIILIHEIKQPSEVLFTCRTLIKYKDEYLIVGSTYQKLPINTNYTDI